MKLPRDFTVGTLSSLPAGCILTAMGILSRLVVGRTYNEMSIKAVLLCLYAALVTGGLHLLASTRPSQINNQVRIPRFSRRVRVMSAIGLALGAAFLAWAFLPYSMPTLKIRVGNHSKYGMIFPDLAAFHVVIPDSPAGSAEVCVT